MKKKLNVNKLQEYLAILYGNLKQSVLGPAGVGEEKQSIVGVVVVEQSFVGVVVIGQSGLEVGKVKRPEAGV